jgi:hypothetical protein
MRGKVAVKTSCSLLLVAAALMALPSAASAAPGWRLPQVVSQDGNQIFTSTARHCGASQFGVYRFRNGTKVAGRFGFVVFTVRITQNGALHRAQFVRFGGELSRSLRRQTRRLLNRVRFHYVAGPPERVESVYPNGAKQASRPFNPVRASC